MRKRIAVTFTVRDPNPSEALRRVLERLTREYLQHREKEQKGGRL